MHDLLFIFIKWYRYAVDADNVIGTQHKSLSYAISGALAAAAAAAVWDASAAWSEPLMMRNSR